MGHVREKAKILLNFSWKHENEEEESGKLGQNFGDRHRGLPG